MLVQSFIRALKQLGEPGSRLIVLRAVGLTLVIFVLLLAGGNWLLGDITITGWDWLDSMLQLGGFFVVVVVLFFVFPAISSIFIAIFLDDIAEAVEKLYYPDDPPGKSADVKASLTLSLRFAVVMIGLNILCLPLYLILFFFPPFNLLLFYALNGYLLAREYFELVGARHMTPAELRRTRKAWVGQLWLAGAVIAFLMTVPIVNLIAPIVATAAMVHIFKTLERRQGQKIGGEATAV